jgi:hypothetical protein
MDTVRHDCYGDDCGYCEERIADAEYERDYPADDYDDYYDGP